jgi:hypothetical protein
MPRKISVSSVLTQPNPSESVNLTTMPKVSASILTKAITSPLNPVRVSILVDKSGSYCSNEAIIDKSTDEFIHMIVNEPAIRDVMLINQTVMSGFVTSTGFLLANEFKRNPLPAGGGSPYGAFLQEAMRVRTDDRIKSGMNIDIIFGDGIATESGIDGPKATDVLATYRDFQTKHDIHTFVVSLKNASGSRIDYDFLKNVSVKHEIYDESVKDIHRAFDQIITLVKNAVKDPTSLGRTSSLNMAEFQGKLAAIPGILHQYVVPPGYVPQPGEKIFGISDGSNFGANPYGGCGGCSE